MRSLLFAATLALCLNGFAAAASPQMLAWRITKTEWTAADEERFGEFIRSIAESGCATTESCLEGPGNPYRSSDPRGLKFAADCAKWAYMLRAYFAWKNGLPFSYVNGVQGGGGDLRFSGNSNHPVSRRDVIDHGGGISALAVLDDIHDSVSTATYRTSAAEQGRVLSDFYSPKLAPGAIRPGTVLYDINGHVGIVYEITEDGRIRYLDADPDHAVSRSVYGPQFGQSTAELGGGFKNFRPLKLVGATRRADGRYVGGHLVVAHDQEIPDFSLEQYRGNVPGANGNGAGALFRYRNVSLGFFEYIRAVMSGGDVAYNPVEQLRIGLASLCENLQNRVSFVALAVKAGIDKKPHPAHISSNIYQTDDAEWEAYATPSRDARLKSGFAQLYQDVSRMVYLWQQKNPQVVYEGASLKEDLAKAYDDEAMACTVTYANSAGKPVTLGFDELIRRLFKLSFDPYMCVERRWGATDPGELATCTDDKTKARWYEAEQRLRNQAERSFLTRAPFSLADLERHVRGSGTDDTPPVDIKDMIDNIGRRALYVSMKPVGF